MTSLLARPGPRVTTGRRADRLQRLLRRLVAWLAAPGIADLDARTLADIGASQSLRAQAELREAWRRGFARDRWRSL